MIASAATAAVSARRMRGPNGMAVTKGRAWSCRRSSSEKPPSGPTSRPSFFSRIACSAGQGIVGVRALVAEDQPPLPVPAGKQGDRISWHRATSGMARMPHCSAASTAFACSRSMPDLGELRVLGDHGLQHAGAHLDRLLHQIVEPARPSAARSSRRGRVPPSAAASARRLRAARPSSISRRSAPAIRRRAR